MILSISGSRKLTDYDYFRSKLHTYFPDPSVIDHVVTGDAEGTDSLAVKYAIEEVRVPVRVWGIKANYKPSHPLIEYIPPKAGGKQYIHIRNKYIAQDGDLLLAFWIPHSKGTISTMNAAKTLGRDVIMVNAKGYIATQEVPL